MVYIVVGAILLSCVVAIALYSVVVYRKNREQMWPWLNTIVATLLSVLFAIMLALGTYTYQEDQDTDKRRDRHEEMVATELGYLHDHLINGESMNVTVGDEVIEVLVTFIQPICLEEASKSGLFSPSISTNMLIVAREVHLYNWLVRNLVPIMTSDSSDTTHIHWILDNIRKARESIIQDIELTELSMGFESSAK